ncbi:hypothetical protein OE88DRAFT_1807545 [Heliocybe sulcata]|uniref:Uncharacterized protein n=1 Tax=Heliocybe sulcata TaxID=5364 RepID=A0A5C3N5W5_9AGAM|nr:hypothetical protein OE88DRAFT_1807545 [Heliocybe sulcata]
MDKAFGAFGMQGHSPSPTPLSRDVNPKQLLHPAMPPQMRNQDVRKADQTGHLRPPSKTLPDMQIDNQAQASSLQPERIPQNQAQSNIGISLTRTLVESLTALKAQNAELVQQHNTMLDRQNQLQQQLDHVRCDMSQQSQHHTVPTLRGGSKAATTRRLRQKHQRMQANNGIDPEDADDEDDDPDHQQTEEERDEARDAHRWRELVDGPLTVPQQKAKLLLQRLERTKFRELTGVKKGDIWPDVDEVRNHVVDGQEVEYYTPDFDEDVTHATNTAICKRVASTVYQEVKAYKKQPGELCHPDVYFNERTIEELAKTTYRGFRDEARTQRDEERQQRKRSNQSRTRQYERRVLKLGHLKEMVPTYIERYGNDPSPILHPDILSDYASGPDAETSESKRRWKIRMGAKLGYDYKSIPKIAWAKMEFWEHIIPEWRSDEATTIVNRLHRLYLKSLDSKALKRYKAYRIIDSNRTSKIPPAISPSPWDFTISMKWWDAEGKKWKKETLNWFTRGDPEGFGSRAPARSQRDIEHDRGELQGVTF